MAQEPERGETVLNRQRPELDPLGVRMGGFLFYPQVNVTGYYNSNLFGEETNEEADYITAAGVSMQLRSNWNNHELNFFATSEAGFYNKWDSENYIDYAFGVDGRADFYRVSKLYGTVTYSRNHEDRASPDDVNGEEPTIFTLLASEIAYAHRFGRFSFKLGGNLERYDFEDVPVPAPVNFINSDDRDRSEYQGLLRMGFEIVPGYEAFMRGTYFNRVYVDDVDDFGFNRNSTGYEAVAGTAIDLTGVTFGNVFIGYRLQEYEDPAFETVEGVQYGGDLTWNPTGLSTINISVSRTVEETTLDGSSGFIATKGALSLDHELLRSVILGVNGSYARNEYQLINRTDNYVKAGIYSNFLFNRHFYVSAKFDYTKRDSNVIGEDYLRNQFMLSLQVQY